MAKERGRQKGRMERVEEEAKSYRRRGRIMKFEIEAPTGMDEDEMGKKD